MVGRTGGDCGANEASWSSCCLLWLGARGFSAKVDQPLSTARRAESVLDPMRMGVAIALKLHIRILIARCLLSDTEIVLYLVAGSYDNNTIPQGYYGLNGLFLRDEQIESLYHYFCGKVRYRFQ